MKKTISTITVAALLTIMAGSAMARPGGHGERPGGGMMLFGPGFHKGAQPFHQLDRMQYILGLTDKQVVKIYNINKEFMDKYFKNRKNSIIIEKIRVEHKKAIEAVLTKKQKEKLEEFIKNHPRKRSNRDDKKRGHGRRMNQDCDR